MINQFTYKDNQGNMHFISDYIRVILEKNIFSLNYINALNECIKTNKENKKIDITQDINLFKTIYKEYNIIEHKSKYENTYYTIEKRGGLK